MEEWKDINGFEGLYKISNYGQVWSCRRSKIMSLKDTKDGYKAVSLYKNDKRYYFRVHRLVGQAFIPNPNNLPVINHLDENKTNNIWTNLEWTTVQENNLYSSYKWSGDNSWTRTKEGRKKLSEIGRTAHKKESKQVKDLRTGVVYDSLREAERQTGISRYKIQHSSDFIISAIGGDANNER